MSNEKKKKTENPTYCLVLFKIEGHETWRSSLMGKKEDFERTFAMDVKSNKPKVTENKFFIIDRLTGKVKEEKIKLTK